MKYIPDGRGFLTILSFYFSEMAGYHGQSSRIFGNHLNIFLLDVNMTFSRYSLTYSFIVLHAICDCKYVWSNLKEWIYVMVSKMKLKGANWNSKILISWKNPCCYFCKRSVYSGLTPEEIPKETYVKITAKISQGTPRESLKEFFDTWKDLCI